MATQKFIHTIDSETKGPHRLRATELINDSDNSLIGIGSETKPVYFKDGVPVECSNALAVNVSSANCVNHSITIGDKSFNGSSNVTIEAKDLGLTGALVFLGVTTSLIADGVTTNPIKINGKDVTAITGNVVLYNHKEFVWASSSWEELGDEGSYALKTVKIITTSPITGGGSLEKDVTIGFEESGVGAGKYGEQTSGTLAHGGAFVVPELTIDKYGRVTGASTKTLTLPTDNDTHYTANLITGASSTAKANAAASANGKVYLNLVENGAVRNSHNIVGSGSVTVTSDANGKITINGIDTNTTSFTITANASDDDVVVLSGTNGTNAVTYSASHAQKGPSSGYTSGNTTTAISGNGGSGTIKIPQITVDKYGHVTAATDESITVTLPTLSTFGITATAAELNVLDGITATVTELNYVDGVTSNIQTQLNNKIIVKTWTSADIT